MLLMLWFGAPLTLGAGPSVHGSMGPVVRQQPSRIVSLVPAVTEMLFAIGAGHAVVGVSSFDNYPAEALSRPRVGALVDPNVERILSLEPDLVVVYGSQDDLMAQLTRAGVGLFRYEHAGLADITTTIRAIGDRVGRRRPAEDLANRIERDLTDMRRETAGRRRPRTALLFGREPGTLRTIYASGGVGFMHDMLETAGAANAFADVKRQNLQASAEILLARAPEVILEIHGADSTPGRLARERDVWRQLAALPAVRSGRVHLLADDRLSIPGPRVVEAVRVMARAIKP
jgi:iron complex transport system substrate-binding protein